MSSESDKNTINSKKHIYKVEFPCKKWRESSEPAENYVNPLLDVREGSQGMRIDIEIVKAAQDIYHTIEVKAVMIDVVFLGIRMKMTTTTTDDIPTLSANSKKKTKKIKFGRHRISSLTIRPTLEIT